MAEKKGKKKRTARFLIEDGWYIFPDSYSWNLGKLNERSTRMGSFDNVTYHATIEQALEFYLRIRRSEACRIASDGHIEDALNTLLSENKRLSDELGRAFREIVENSYRENG